MKKRIVNIPITALLLTLTVLLCACGARDDHEDRPELSLSDLGVETGSTSALLPEPNVGGEKTEFFVLCEKDAESSFVPSGESENILDKKAFERNARIADEYGIVIREISTGDVVTKVKNDILSGKTNYGTVVMRAKNAPSLITSGSLADLAPLGFSPSAKGYSESVVNALSIAKKQYLAVGNATPSLLLSSYCVALNTELCKKTGESAESVIESAKNGKLNAELMYRLSSSLASSDAGEEITKSEGARYISVSADDAYALFNAGGLDLYTADPVTDGFRPLETSEMTDALYEAMLLLYGIDLSSEKFDWETAKSGVTPLFSVMTVNELGSLVSEGAPYVALPMPKMTAGQENYRSMADADTFACTAVPAAAEDGAYAVKVMNLIYSLSDDIYSTVRKSVAGNERDARVFDIIANNTYASALEIFGWGDLPSFMTSAINEHLKTSVFSLRAAERINASVAALAISSESVKNDTKPE